MKITHYDLFAGIGGFSLALDTIFNEYERQHIFCEWEAFPTAVLKKHWPDGTYYGDIADLVETLTGVPTLEYIDRYGLSTKNKIQQLRESLQSGNVDTGHSNLSRSNKTGDARYSKTQGYTVSEQQEIRQGESLFQGDKSEQSCTRHTGTCDGEGNCNKENTLRNLSGHRSIQGREDEDTGTPSRLQQATGCDVVVSEMPSPVAQGEQSNTIINRTPQNDTKGDSVDGRQKINHERIITNAKCEGWKGERRQAEGQHRLCDRSGEDKDLTILTAGVPCQPASHAGKRKGTDDDRWLWPHTLAVVRAVRPDWCILENVRGFLTIESGLALEAVCTQMEELGYEVQPIVIPAVAVGAPHRRDRVWIIAHAIDNRPRRKERGVNETQDSVPQEHRAEDSAAREFERTTCDGYDHRPWETDWREVALATCHDRMDDGLPRWMDGVTISASRHRKERLKACGNAIVPQVAMEIFSAIRVVIHTP